MLSPAIRALVLIVGSVGFVAACSHHAAAPADAPVHVELGLVGQPAVLDRAALAGHAPCDHDATRQAYRAVELWPAPLAAPGVVLEIVARNKTEQTYSNPGKPVNGREVILVVDRRGRVQIARLPPTGALAALDHAPPSRVDDLATLRIGPAKLTSDTPAPIPELSLPVHGARETVLHTADLERVGRLPSGDAPAAWPLRPLIANLDPQLRVVAVEVARGEPVPIPPADWAAKDRQPILKLNHRGQLRLMWVSIPAGARLGDRSPETVTALRVGR